MSKKKDGLIEILADYFWSYKSYELDGVLKGYGISPDETLNPNSSKKVYARSGLVKMTEEEIVELSKRIARDAESISFNKQMEEYFGDSIFKFTYITRRKLAEYFDTCPNFEGKMKLNELLQGIWDMNEPCTRDKDLFIFDRMTLGEYIIKHVVINDDMSYKDTQYVKGINEIIGADGFELVVSGKISNELIYKIYKRQAAKSNMKNLIFAPLGKKPDIVIDDAIANDIKIVGDTDNCLLYDFEPNADGLLWNTLVQWWGSAHTSENIQKDLFKRLLNSLDSQPEKDFFTQYYTIYQNANEYPALIPQVYLHYDPHAKTWRGSNVVYTHQRMDFLMLLPNGIRVVIEIDGKQHYSKGDISSPKLYAEMMVDTRNLQLKGYEVYRFGGYEFMDSQQMKQTVRDFFEMLFKKYSI